MPLWSADGNSRPREILELLRSRKQVNASRQVVRSTRFGSWPPAEVLEQRSAFRAELDDAIQKEGSDVRRIWNVSSADDVNRLREMIDRYQGRNNHSIRAYFELPHHALPELLVVDGRGASMSFPSVRAPRGLDWMMRFKRDDLVHVVRDYFDVLWDRADRVLDSGEEVSGWERALQQPQRPMPGQTDGTGGARV